MRFDIVQAYLRMCACMGTQLTIRNVSPELSDRLKTMASEQGTSVNKLVVSLLQEAAGVDERRLFLRRLVTWTDEDACLFDAAVAEQRTIDEDMWR